MTSQLSKFSMLGRGALSTPSRSRRQIVTASTLALLGLLGACATEPAETFDATACDPAEVYRVDGVRVPQTSTEARTVAFDLDDDDLFDNQIGMLTGALHTMFGFDLSAGATARVADDVPWQLAIRRCPAGEIAVTLGPPERAPVYLRGEERDGELVVRGAGADVPIATMFDPEATFPGAGWVTSARTELRLVPRSDGGFDGRLGVALPHAAAFDAIVEAFAPYMNAHIDEVPEMREQYDDDHDGQITLDEVRRDTFTKSLLAPDLELDGAMHLSFGLALSAR